MVTQFRWREFTTQERLRQAVRLLIDPQPFDTAFSAPLISDLIVERHYFCRWRSLRPESFKKTREDVPYRFYGRFEHGWHPVSRAKCLRPPPTKRDLLIRAFRDRITEANLAYRRQHPQCAHCGAPAVETHHAEPTFDQIVQAVFAATTADEIDTALATWNWFEAATFSQSKSAPLALRFDQYHANARLEALCRACHLKVRLQNR